MNKSMHPADWLLLMLLSFLWGGSFFFNEIVLRQLSPFTLVFARVFMAAVFLWVFIIFSRGRRSASPTKFSGQFVIVSMVLGFFNNFVPFSLIVWGQQYIEGGEASIINAAAPLFSAILGQFIRGGEKLTKNRIIGLIVGWFGVFLLVGQSGFSESGNILYGRLAVLGASLCYALGALYGKRFNFPPMVLSAGMLSAAAIYLLPFVIFFDEPWGIHLHTGTLLSMISLSLFSTALAYLIYFKLLARVGATNLLLVTFLIPLTALILGMVFLGETPGWRAYLGFGIITAGLLIVDGRFVRKK
ncbi:MAG: DMT family transporter [Spirochaetales bacterium]|nr:DMT family transporter [Spirochaetales bacterium]